MRARREQCGAAQGSGPTNWFVHISRSGGVCPHRPPWVVHKLWDQGKDPTQVSSTGKQVSRTLTENTNKLSTALVARANTCKTWHSFDTKKSAMSIKCVERLIAAQNPSQKGSATHMQEPCWKHRVARRYEPPASLFGATSRYTRTIELRTITCLPGWCWQGLRFRESNGWHVVDQRRLTHSITAEYWIIRREWKTQTVQPRPEAQVMLVRSRCVQKYLNRIVSCSSFWEAVCRSKRLQANCEMTSNEEALYWTW